MPPKLFWRHHARSRPGFGFMRKIGKPLPGRVASSLPVCAAGHVTNNKVLKVFWLFTVVNRRQNHEFQGA